MERTVLKTLRFGGEYEKYFNSKDYLTSYYKSPEGKSAGGDVVLPFFLLNFHKFWSSLGSNNLTMLEFGGGPCIHTLISACPFVREIVFAEFTDGNRKEVEAWQKRETSSHDWSPFFKHVVQTLEGKSKEEAIKREEELRSKISGIIPCNIRETNPLHLTDESSTTDRQKFDIVSTTLCLESAVESDITYCEGVAKLSKLLKPEGHLIIGGILNDPYYKVGDQMFRSFSLSESLLRRALDEAGIKNVQFVSSNKDVVKDKPVSSNEYFFACGVLKNH